ILSLRRLVIDPRSIMSVPAPPIPASADAPPPDELRKALVGELRRVVAPLAESTKTALACVAGSETDWVASHPARPCSHNPAAGVACLNGKAVPNREKEIIAPTAPSAEGMQFVACCEAGCRETASALRHLIEACLRHAEGERERETLQRRLKAAGDSLDA